MKRLIRLAAVALTAVAAAHASAADSAGPWAPTRQVTLIVPYAPGGGTDATARAVAQRLTQIWHHPVIVENVGGADGLIGTRRVIEAAPDGYTLLFQVPSLLLMKYQSSLKGIDPLARLEPVSAVAVAPTAVVVGPNIPAKTLKELVDYCRKAPAPCSAGSGENISKMRARQFAADYQLGELTVVSYRGTGPIVTDLVGGSLTMAFTGLTAALPLHKAGRLHIIATEGARRASALPDIPTTIESGWGDTVSQTWYGMLAPKGTPVRISESIAKAMQQTRSDPEVLRAIGIAGAEPAFTTPAEFAALIRTDDARLGALAKRFPFD